MRKKIMAITALAASMAMSAWAADYTLRPGDQLSIMVTQEESMSTSPTSSEQTPYQIRPDGKVSIPLAGEIYANGMTVNEFTDTVAQRLSRYIINPDVAVNIVKLGGVRVYVFGEINKPGAYELTKGHTVIDAIGAADGFNWDTGKKKIYLIHQDNTNKIITINLNKMLQTGNMAENYEMREGDILYLTRNGRISFSRDIAPLFSAAYMASKINSNN
nr:polysaccharide biosynthesis/export family protein [uncultured Megasphaera sp.]